MGPCYSRFTDAGEQIYSDIFSELTSYQLTIQKMNAIYVAHLIENKLDSKNVFSDIQTFFYNNEQKTNQFYDCHVRLFDLIVSRTDTTDDFNKFALHFVLFLNNKGADAESVIFKGLSKGKTFLEFKEEFVKFIVLSCHNCYAEIFEEYSKLATQNDVEAMTRFNEILSKQKVTKAAEKLFASMLLDETTYMKAGPVKMRQSGLFTDRDKLKEKVIELCLEKKG